MYFLIDAARGACENIGAFVQPTNLAAKCLYVGEIGVVAYRTIESYFVYPKATLFGSVVDLTVGSRGPVALAAQVVLVMHKTLALINHAHEVAKEARWLARAFLGTYPIPVQWLRQKESYAPDIRQSLRVQFLCHSPEFVAEGTLRSEIVLASTLRLIAKAVRVGFTFFELGLGVFISPIMQTSATRLLFRNIIGCYEEMQKNPLSLLKDLEEHPSFADDFFSRFGSSTSVNVLTGALRSGVRTIAPYQTTISTIFREVVENVQEGAFFYTNMTTGLEIAPLGLPTRDQTQPTAVNRTCNVNSRSTDSPRKSQHAGYRERFFGTN